MAGPSILDSFLDELEKIAYESVRTRQGKPGVRARKEAVREVVKAEHSDYKAGKAPPIVVRPPTRHAVADKLMAGMGLSPEEMEKKERPPTPAAKPIPSPGGIEKRHLEPLKARHDELAKKHQEMVGRKAPATPSPSPIKVPRKFLSRGAKIGIGAGVGAAALGGYLYHQHKKFKEMSKEASWEEWLQKLSARAGVRMIQKMVQGGNLAGANRLATTAGVLKPAIAGRATAAGSQLKVLGRGSEGSAALVAHPQHGVSVRKLYDPKGISSQQIIDRKAQLGAKINSPSMAKHLGEAQGPGGSQMHFSEYVHSGQGPSFTPGSQAERQALSHTKTQTQKAVHEAGGQAQDVRKANMAWDSQSGQYKTVDYIPGQKGEFVRGGASTPENRIHTTDTGQQIWNKGYDPMAGLGAQKGQLEGQVLGRPGQGTPTPQRPAQQAPRPAPVVSPQSSAATAPSGRAMRRPVQPVTQKSRANAAFLSTQPVASNMGTAPTQAVMR